jgi:hypothetical protein
MAAACAAPIDPSLVEEDDAAIGKADAFLRPYGTWERSTLDAGQPGLRWLTLTEDRRYHRIEHEEGGCADPSCTVERSDAYRFAASDDRPYVVLYEDGVRAVAYEYMLDGELLHLRATDGDDWFVMFRSFTRWCETAADCAEQPSECALEGGEMRCEANACVEVCPTGTDAPVCEAHGERVASCLEGGHHDTARECVMYEQLWDRDAMLACCETATYDYCGELAVDREICRAYDAAVDDCVGLHGYPLAYCVYSLGGEAAFTMVRDCCEADDGWLALCPAPTLPPYPGHAVCDELRRTYQSCADGGAAEGCHDPLDAEEVEGCCARDGDLPFCR